MTSNMSVPTRSNYFSATPTSAKQLLTSNPSTVLFSPEGRTGDSFASTQKKQLHFGGDDELEAAKTKRDKAWIVYKRAFDTKADSKAAYKAYEEALSEVALQIAAKIKRNEVALQVAKINHDNTYRTYTTAFAKFNRQDERMVKADPKEHVDAYQTHLAAKKQYEALLLEKKKSNPN
jgi:hypothetical protein